MPKDPTKDSGAVPKAKAKARVVRRDPAKAKAKAAPKGKALAKAKVEKPSPVANKRAPRAKLLCNPLRWEPSHSQRCVRAPAGIWVHGLGSPVF